MTVLPPDPSENPARGAIVSRMDGREFRSVYESWKLRLEAALRASEGPWAIVGIKRRGAVLASRLRAALHSESLPLLYGEIDISLYRDDYHLRTEKPMVLGSEIAFRVDGVKILLVDDVLYTGRTVRAAMELLLDFGRPRWITLAVFIDRGHRELPIRADVVGKEIATEQSDQVLVRLSELGEVDGVEVVRRS
ncbi:MAG TPA: bifunctional pyr operon transcriptional regulator/uracil phosphoribosyltransferase PyrR [Planctomycetota bacterium]|jgi:pyrimidine operon attenuation protein/uracil phosphoribosyltransferase|nr:bifunctional pyr operon transcriptional regulator/uracil phosphoribosyltransferase PyrR [Planctomycetota bacterium]